MFVALSSMTGRALAFDEVVAVINKVRSATWKTTTTVQRTPEEKVVANGVGMFLAPAHERTETTTGGAKSIVIADGEKNRLVTYAPSTKTASFIDLKNVSAEWGSPMGKSFQGMQELVARAQAGKAGKVERLGAQTIDGRAAEGFRIELGSIEVKIWADPKTSLPIRVEHLRTSPPEVHIVMTDFQVDVELDESLFSLDVPEGYTVQQPLEIDLSKKPISYLAEALKIAAELNGGVFPANLQGADGLQSVAQAYAKKAMENKGEDAAQSMRQVQELIMKLGGAIGFLTALTPDHDWHYAGRDVQLNTPDRPIFWYRSHKSSATYTVLYADLSMKEVAAGEVPNLPSTEGARNR
jgi:outer membrane lipoprotein-sorting protein